LVWPTRLDLDWTRPWLALVPEPSLRLLSHICVFVHFFLDLFSGWSTVERGLDRITFQHPQEFSRTLRLIRNSAGLRITHVLRKHPPFVERPLNITILFLSPSPNISLYLQYCLLSTVYCLKPTTNDLSTSQAKPGSKRAYSLG
jgi:hypothetical protein